MTPLTAMRGYIETLSMQDVRLDAETRTRYLGIVEDETHRLERIVGDLLDVAKLETGGITLRHDVVSVAALFERVRARHEREAATRHIELATEIGAGTDTLRGDPDRLEQALQNLVANALRHTRDGGVVTLAAMRREASIAITVRDSGPGISDEHLPHIFDRFYKADSSRRSRLSKPSSSGMAAPSPHETIAVRCSK
jgi:signal transduction histidine kinase